MGTRDFAIRRSCAGHPYSKALVVDLVAMSSVSSLRLHLSEEMNGGRDRTRTCDLLRVKHYLNSNLIDGTDTSIYVFGVIIV